MIIHFINNTFVDIEFYNNPKLTTKIQNKQYPSHLILFYANKSKQTKVNFIRRFIQVKSHLKNQSFIQDTLHNSR